MAKVIQKTVENGVTLHKCLYVGHVTGRTSTGLYVSKNRREQRTEASEWFPFEAKASGACYVREI